MNCDTSRFLLHTLGPGSAELDPADRAEWQQHLDACIACAALARQHRLVDDRLGQAMHAVAIPIGLRDRLLTRLDAERRPVMRRWVVSRISAAAAVLLVVVGGLWAWSLQRTRISVLAVQSAMDAAASEGREGAEAWLKSAGYKLPPPPRFNYGLLRGYEMVEFAGKLVPQFSFAAPVGPEIVDARVLVLTADRFDLKALPDRDPASGVVHRIEVWFDDPNNPRVAYFIIHRGEKLEVLLTADPQAA